MAGVEPERARDFAALLGTVSEVYGRDKPTTQAVALYLLLLERFTFEQVRMALLTHMGSSRFFPVPADIVLLLEGSVEDRASMAWGSVLKAISKAGGWNRVEFEDPCIAPCLEALGGWGHLCATLTKEREHAVERAFSAQYRKQINKIAVLGGGGAGASSRKGCTMELQAGRFYSVSKDGRIVERDAERTLPLAAHNFPGGANRHDVALHDEQGRL